ncbi:natterin-3-like, partial [Seriola dumerili]|uniref:natterin-3-like n=1 Tax=Seriola dumerili TaxID=41447 RepID=UPI000BBF3392
NEFYDAAIKQLQYINLKATGVRLSEALCDHNDEAFSVGAAFPAGSVLCRTSGHRPRILKQKRRNEITFNDEDLISWSIGGVTYNTDGVKVIPYPPEVLRKSTVTNNECQSVVKKFTLSKTYQVEQRWDIGSSTTQRVGGSITAQIPYIGSAGVEFSELTTKQFTRGTTVVESITHSFTVEQSIPPNHSCSVSMLGYKYRAEIPFSAGVSHLYRNGGKYEHMSGTYDKAQIGEVRAVVDRCEPIANAKPCA